MQRVERQMEKLSSRQAELHEQMAAASETVDLEKLSGLQQELNGIQTELAEAEEAWLEASEIVES